MEEKEGGRELPQPCRTLVPRVCSRAALGRGLSGLLTLTPPLCMVEVWPGQGICVPLARRCQARLHPMPEAGRVSRAPQSPSACPPQAGLWPLPLLGKDPRATQTQVRPATSTPGAGTV